MENKTRNIKYGNLKLCTHVTCEKKWYKLKIIKIKTEGFGVQNCKTEMRIFRKHCFL